LTNVLTRDAARPWCSRGIELERMTVAAGKDMSIPKGMMTMLTNVIPQ